MKKTLTTKKVAELYQILSKSSYSKLDDEDKIKVWKSTRGLKDIASKYSEDVRDANEKLMPSDFMDKYKKAKEYEETVVIKKPIISKEEYQAIVKEFTQYSKLIEKAIKEFAETEVEVDVCPLTETAFGKLMASNKWNMEQTLIVSDFIVDNN